MRNLGHLRERGHRDEAQAALMDAYEQLTISGTNTRAAASLTCAESHGAGRADQLRVRRLFATLLDRGVYLCSVSSMYRVLAENTMVKERRRQARHPARKIPELVATGPGQVYTRDITKLAGPVKGVYYDAYVMIDIYSRYIVGVPRPGSRR